MSKGFSFIFFVFQRLSAFGFWNLIQLANTINSCPWKPNSYGCFSENSALNLRRSAAFGAALPVRLIIPRFAMLSASSFSTRASCDPWRRLACFITPSSIFSSISNRGLLAEFLPERFYFFWAFTFFVLVFLFKVLSVFSWLSLCTYLIFGYLSHLQATTPHSGFENSILKCRRNISRNLTRHFI